MFWCTGVQVAKSTYQIWRIYEFPQFRALPLLQIKRALSIRAGMPEKRAAPTAAWQKEGTFMLTVEKRLVDREYSR
jgi:hypothetical protein